MQERQKTKHNKKKTKHYSVNNRQQDLCLEISEETPHNQAKAFKFIPRKQTNKNIHFIHHFFSCSVTSFVMKAL